MLLGEASRLNGGGKGKLEVGTKKETKRKRGGQSLNKDEGPQEDAENNAGEERLNEDQSSRTSHVRHTRERFRKIKGN